MASTPLLQAHQDVMGAEPDSAEAKAKLVEELKARGNAAFKRGALDEAEMLYGKALEHDAATAALWGNRCAARLGMKRFELALQDADEAVKVDGKWAKGHFRRGQALVGLARWDDAKRAFEQTLALEPGNKDAVKELERVAGKLSSSASAAVAAAAAAAPAVVPSIKPSSTPAKPQAAAAAAAKEEKSTTMTDEDELDEDLKGVNLRGYKTLPDGRKTTFFNMEIPPEEKARLAAENRPKPIAPGSAAATNPAAAQPSKVSGNGVSGSGAPSLASSSWNTAGTFEERDVTKWAEDKIKAAVLGATSICDVNASESVLVEATAVNAFDGHASVSFIRGKKKYPFDMSFDVAWTCELSSGASVSGKLHVREFSSESPDLDTELRWDSRASAGASAAKLADHVKKDFAKVVHERLKEFLKEFMAL